MKKPEVIEIYACNGALSHYALVDIDTGEKLWSEAPEECIANGHPVVYNGLVEINNVLLVDTYDVVYKEELYNIEGRVKKCWVSEKELKQFLKQ